MRKSTWLPCAGMLLAASAPAQDVPRVEAFAGYSFSRVEAGKDLSDINLNGWNLAVTANLNSWLGVTADVSGHYGSLAFDTDLSRHAFLIGPQLTYRNGDGRLRPFAHALFGGVRAHRGTTNAPLGSPLPVSSAGETAFGMVLGGGVDHTLNERLAIRLIQAEYLMTRFDEASGIVCIQTITTPCPTTRGGTQNNLRLSVGVSYRFGRE